VVIVGVLSGLSWGFASDHPWTRDRQAQPVTDAPRGC
jgi:hypothetical protein